MKPTLNLIIKRSVLHPSTQLFKVTSTKDTTQFYPGDTIEERDLKRIVQEKRITVNIKEAKS